MIAMMIPKYLTLVVWHKHMIVTTLKIGVKVTPTGCTYFFL